MRPPVDLSGMRKVLAKVQAKQMPFYPKGEMYLGGTLPRAHYNYGHDIGDGLRSNVIMAPIMWIMRVFTEARAVVQSQRGNTGIWDIREGHDLARLIKKPNPFYSASPLWKATIISYILDGNAYWLKARNVYGDVVQLWYAPHWLITPRWPTDNSQFISHYDYSPGGETFRLAPRDVVHFRFGIDPNNPRLGYGSLKPLMREVFIDEEAASFSATMMTNEGVPGIVISPAGDTRMTKEQVEDIKKTVTDSVGGDGRGGAVAFGVPIKMEQYGHDSNQMALGNIRDISEERVCALIGIPAAVVGFGSGLQSTKVGATMRELMKAAWTTCIIPMQKDLAEQLTDQLLSDFTKQPDQYQVEWDRSGVSAFQEDKDATATRAGLLVEKGILRVDRAQEMCGLEVDTTQKVYLRPTSSQAVDDKGEPLEPVVPTAVQNRMTGVPAPNGASNGNGNGSNPEEEE